MLSQLRDLPICKSAAFGMSPSIKSKLPIWLGVWFLTRGLMIVMVGYWQPGGPHYEDVDLYGEWSHFMVDTGVLPNEELWQYPPGAAFLMLAPRLISFAAYQPSFVALLLVFDLIGFWLMTRFAQEEKREVGIWIWLLGIPLLATIPAWNGLPLLRFDLTHRGGYGGTAGYPPSSRLVRSFSGGRGHAQGVACVPPFRRVGS